MRCEGCRRNYPPGDLYDGDLCRDCAVETGVEITIAPADAFACGAREIAGRSCEVCGVAISGYANRRTCTTRCRVALHRRQRKVASS